MLLLHRKYYLQNCLQTSATNRPDFTLNEAFMITAVSVAKTALVYKKQSSKTKAAKAKAERNKSEATYE